MSVEGIHIKSIMFNFEKLDTWNEALNFAHLVYSLTKALPDSERFGLTAQMRRAAVSVPSNIAEGSSRSSRQDFARFIEIASGSLYEVVTQSALAKRQQFISEDDFQHIYLAADKLSRMLAGLRRSLDT